MGLPKESIARLKDFLAQLPPRSQAMLMREFERALESGKDTVVAQLVLDQLRGIVRQSETNERMRGESSCRLVFATLDPFLVDTQGPLRAGQIRRSSLDPIWNWLANEAASEPIRLLEAAQQSNDKDLVSRESRKVQLAAADAAEKMLQAARNGDGRALHRIGAPEVGEDLGSMAIVFRNREPLQTFATWLSGTVRTLGDSQSASILQAMNVPSLQQPQVLPFALALLLQRLAAPWQAIRLAVNVAGSDDEVRIAGTAYGVVVAMIIHDLSEHVGQLREAIKVGRLGQLDAILKPIHDGLRGLRAEIDIRPESVWGKKLSAIRSSISDLLRSELDGVPGRVRRLLRIKPDKEISPAMRVDAREVEETAQLIDFVAVCRTYASELAINEVTRRAHSDLQQYLESATGNLVESLRVSDDRIRPYRQAQVDAAIRFCDVMFGADYAALMRKSAEMALTGERKSSRTA